MNAAGTPPTSLFIPKWDNTAVGSLTYYDLEDAVSGGRSMDFWTNDLMTESIINWAIAGGVFDRSNTNLEDSPSSDLTQSNLDTIEVADPGATTDNDSSIKV
jgi:hypothetical protein